VSRDRRVHAGQQERMAQMVRLGFKVFLVLLVWTALSVPVAILVGKALRGPPERAVPPDLLDRPVHRVHAVRPVSTAPRVIPDRQVPRAHRAR